ncbi:uncharacterized protein V1516DRAFT_187454 [Lipomyces oligophaga]|uniref:uncharacterized protein n=1 Tax=Lipomyces oligophaga TaxID=45792 RepID=UPI0034CF06AF
MDVLLASGTAIVSTSAASATARGTSTSPTLGVSTTGSTGITYISTSITAVLGSSSVVSSRTSSSTSNIGLTSQASSSRVSSTQKGSPSISIATLSSYLAKSAATKNSESSTSQSRISSFGSSSISPSSSSSVRYSINSQQSSSKSVKNSLSASRSSSATATLIKSTSATTIPPKSTSTSNSIVLLKSSSSSLKPSSSSTFTSLSSSSVRESTASISSITSVATAASSSTLASSSHSSHRTTVIASVIGSVGGILILTLIFVLYLRRRKRQVRDRPMIPNADDTHFMRTTLRGAPNTVHRPRRLQIQHHRHPSSISNTTMQTQQASNAVKSKPAMVQIYDPRRTDHSNLPSSQANSSMTSQSLWASRRQHPVAVEGSKKSLGRNMLRSEASSSSQSRQSWYGSLSTSGRDSPLPHLIEHLFTRPRRNTGASLVSSSTQGGPAGSSIVSSVGAGASSAQMGGSGGPAHITGESESGFVKIRGKKLERWQDPEQLSIHSISGRVYDRDGKEVVRENEHENLTSTTAVVSPESLQASPSSEAESPILGSNLFPIRDRTHSTRTAETDTESVQSDIVAEIPERRYYISSMTIGGQASVPPPPPLDIN